VSCTFFLLNQFVPISAHLPPTWPPKLNQSSPADSSQLSVRESQGGGEILQILEEFSGDSFLPAANSTPQWATQLTTTVSHAQMTSQIAQIAQTNKPKRQNGTGNADHTVVDLAVRSTETNKDFLDGKITFFECQQHAE